MAQTKLRTEQIPVDTDDTMAADSDAVVPSQKAVKAYVAANGGGVGRSGSTTDGHLAVWNGTDADSIKDGGPLGGGTGDVVGPASATDGNLAVFDSTTGKLIKDGGPVPTPTLNDYICIVDQKTAGTHGGTFTAGAWRTRDLNTIRSNVGSHASLSSNQITLAAGTYEVRASAVGHAVNKHQLKLRDITNSADLLIGTSEFCDKGFNTGTRSFISGTITLTGSTVIELQHYCTFTTSNVGFGVGDTLGVVNIYAMIEFWKVG